MFIPHDEIINTFKNKMNLSEDMLIYEFYVSNFQPGQQKIVRILF